MINPHKDVSFEAAGKTYTLRYSHLALVKLENKLNKGLVQILGDMSKPQNLRLGTIVALLWAGLQKHHPEVSEDAAADLLDDIEGGTQGAMTMIDAAFSKAFSATPGTKGTNPQQRADNGSGMTSLSSSLATDMIPNISGTSHQKN